MNILLCGKPISNAAHGAEVGVHYALEKLGHQVSIFDVGKKAPEENLNKPYDIVLCMGAGIPKKFDKDSRLIKAITNNFSILWNSEPIKLPSYYSKVEEQKKLFNLHATFDANEIPIYENMGCNATFLPQAGHPEWYHPLNVAPKKFACFVGSVGGKWKNRVHFLERIKRIIPNSELTITTTFDAKTVNEIYNDHFLVLNLGLYHKELGSPEKLASYGFQQRIFEAYCAGVPCLTNFPDPVYNSGEDYKNMFINHKDIIYYDNNTFDAILKYLYQNKHQLIKMRNNMDVKKHTYQSRLANFIKMLERTYSL